MLPCQGQIGLRTFSPKRKDFFKANSLLLTKPLQSQPCFISFLVLPNQMRGYHAIIIYQVAWISSSFSKINLFIGFQLLGLESRQREMSQPDQVGQCHPIGQGESLSTGLRSRPPDELDGFVRSGVITESRPDDQRPIGLEKNLGLGKLTARSSGGYFDASRRF